MQSRIARLERDKVVTGYTVRTSGGARGRRDPGAGDDHRAPKQSAAVEAAIRRMADVRALHSVSGPSDMIAEASTRSINEMGRPDRSDRRPGRRGEDNLGVILSTRIDR
ncbi:MAG: Lrp/AsnC family transcriptional regulator [Caulobacteraceae bacterium]